MSQCGYLVQRSETHCVKHYYTEQIKNGILSLWELTVFHVTLLIILLNSSFNKSAVEKILVTYVIPVVVEVTRHTLIISAVSLYVYDWIIIVCGFHLGAILTAWLHVCFQRIFTLWTDEFECWDTNQMWKFVVLFEGFPELFQTYLLITQFLKHLGRCVKFNDESKENEMKT